MKNISKVICFMTTFSISISSFANTAIKFSTGNDYPPFTDQKLNGGGLFTQFVNAILKSADIKSSIEFIPWKRAEVLTESGEYMGAFPYMKTPDREKNYQFSDIVYTIQSKIIVHKDSNIKFDKITDIENLKGKTFCKPKGYGLEKFVEDLVDRKYITQRATADMKGCVTLLEKKEIDFIPDSPLIIYQIMASEKIPKDHFKILAPSLQDTNLMLMVTKKETDSLGNKTSEFMKKFNAALQKLKSDGTLKKIEDNF